MESRRTRFPDRVMFTEIGPPRGYLLSRVYRATAAEDCKSHYCCPSYRYIGRNAWPDGFSILVTRCSETGMKSSLLLRW
jgi:hypothetical protein